ncbi:hypothetical protein LXL04_016765 [Taraxacum kok-saghyz]
MFRYSLKLEEFNNKLVKFFQIEGQVIQIRDIAKVLAVVNNTNVKVDWIYTDLRDKKQYGWRVPGPPIGIVAFGEPLEKLKAEVVGGGDDYSVLVVAAPGGCGKTTLVKMLCHDDKIRENFGENIFFVTVSERPNLMMIASDLCNNGPFMRSHLICVQTSGRQPFGSSDFEALLRWHSLNSEANPRTTA